jgi:hypothetical protein
MRECIDEGMLQGYFDGELSIEMMESVSTHLVSCLVCKQAARELESESLLLSEALEPEFALSVPSERLRHRVDAAIAGLRVVSPAGSNVVGARGSDGGFKSIADLFTFSPQRAFGYAGLAAVVLLAVVFGLIKLRSTPVNAPPVAINQSAPMPVTNSTADKPTPDKLGEAVATVKTPPVNVEAPKPAFIPAVYHPKKVIARPVEPSESAHVKLLPGERSYLKTIAALDTTIKADGNRPMRPGLQSEYERNLAMVDRAIAATRRAAKNNPNDPDAAEFMFAAYQTKVDFLNQVADARLPSARR